MGKKTIAASIITTMRMPPELRAALEKLAADDQRTLTSLMLKVLSDYAKSKKALK